MIDIQLALRVAVAAGLSVALASLFRLGDSVYALIAAVIVTDLSPLRTRQLALQRVIGTIIGATSGAAFSQALGPAAWAIGISVLTAQLICHLTRAQDGAKVAGYICGVVIVSHGVHPWSYAFLRFTETLLGIGVAWLISLIPKLIQTNGADR